MCLHLSPFQLIQFVFYKLPIPIIVSFLAGVFLYILMHNKLSLEAVQLHEKKGHLTWSAIYPVILPELFRYGLKFLLSRLKKENKIVFQLPISIHDLAYFLYIGLCQYWLECGLDIY